MGEVSIRDLFEGLFNSEIEDKDSLWEDFLLYNFSKEELNQLNEIKKNSTESLVDFSSLSDEKLKDILCYDFHDYGYFNDHESEFTGIMGDVLVEYKFNEKINLGYIFYREVGEVECFNSLDLIEKEFNEYVEGYGK